jgi:hypothetical protein
MRRGCGVVRRGASHIVECGNGNPSEMHGLYALVARELS